MVVQWRMNKKVPQTTPPDAHALKLHSLAQSLNKYDRDSKAILARLNWCKQDAPARARDLIRARLSKYLELVSDYADEIGAEPERVFRNILAWSSESQASTLLAIAKWDKSQKKPILKALKISSLPRYKDNDAGRDDMFLKRRSVEPHALEQLIPDQFKPEFLETLIPNHPTVILKAYFRYLDGPNRTKQKGLVKDVFIAADGLNWKASRNSALDVISNLFFQYKVKATFSAPMFFRLSVSFGQEVLKFARSYPSLIPITEITKIRAEIHKRNEKAEARYKASLAYRIKFIQWGNLNDPMVKEIIREAKTSKPCERALLNGLRGVGRLTRRIPSDYEAYLRDLPNSETFITLKLLLRKTEIVFDIANNAKLNVANRALNNLNDEARALTLNAFQLKRTKPSPELSSAGKAFIQDIINKQLASSDRITIKNALSNALICVELYQLDISKGIRSLLRQENGLAALLDRIQDFVRVHPYIDDVTRNKFRRDIKEFRKQTGKGWDDRYATWFSNYWPDLIFAIERRRLREAELRPLIQNGEIERVKKAVGVNGIVQSQAWGYLLTSWDTGQNVMPKSVINLASSNALIGADLVTRAAGGMTNQQLKKFTPKILVKSLANRAKHCRRIATIVSDADLIALLPWAQKHWLEKPTHCAAIQLALAFGFEHAAFLVLLAKRLMPYAAATGGTYFNDLYQTYEIPKKSGGYRKITEPIFALKAFQRSVLEKGIGKVKLHSAATGFVKGKGIVDNAMPHVKQDIVVNVDIRGFFPETNFKLIRHAVDVIGPKKLSDEARWLLAQLLSYDGGLPAGAPSSPGLANIIMRPVDIALSKACKMLKVNYTRYADDLTFSGGAAPKILPFAKEVISELGFELDNKKTNIYRKGRRQLVTGLVVNQKPNLAKPLRRRLRAAVHARAKNANIHWNGMPMSDEELLGRIAFLAQTQPEEAELLRAKLREVTGARWR